MEDFSLLDEEEKMLLVTSGFSLLFTTSFIYSYIKVFRHSLNYSQIPIIALSFSYLNSLVYFYYSDLIYHDYMKLCNKISIIISIILIIIYLLYEFKEDKIDMFLNVGIIMAASWAIKKLVIDILKDDDKVKTTCSYSTMAFLSTIIEWFVRAYKEKNRKILNIFSGLFLVLASISWIVFGYIYQELSFLVPNIIGLVLSLAYIAVWLYLRKFGSSPEENKGAIDIQIKIKNESKEDVTNVHKVNDEEEKMVKN